ncbi:MAG TPA: phage tail sheath family protein [Flavitalea sp.]|nr:phage tail sheath family protein [Flavitalea sp.]
MAIYKTPGVYIEEIPLFPPSVAQVETAIPAFIGYTKKAKKENDDLTQKPTRITSLVEYTQYFGLSEDETDLEVVLTKDSADRTIIEVKFETGKTPSVHNMYYALQMFFANGGGPCYIVSVAPTGTAGIDKAKLKAGLDALKKEDEPTLIIFPEAVTGLDADYGALMSDALKQCKELKDRFAIMDVKVDATKTIAENATAFRTAVTGTPEELKYGAAYYPNVKTTFPFSFQEADVKVTDNRGGTALPGTLDAVAPVDNSVYNLIKAKLNTFFMAMAPSSSVAGIYASVDRDRGVWKAPANVPVSNVIGPDIKVTDSDQDGLNIDTTAGKSINVIRAFIGKGTLVWGARTLAGNDNEWRYISVRRFFNMVEESVKKATYQFVFEPNDANTWVKVRAMIENYLTVLWRQGALAGAKPEHAFYVRVGLNITMTAQDILEGYMHVEIGMAVVRPAEFIVLKFSHKMQES